jgi:hypothetical protein
MHAPKIDNLLLHPVRFHIAHVIVSNGGRAHIRRVRKHVIENDSSPAMSHHVVAMEAAGIIVKRKLIDDATASLCAGSPNHLPSLLHKPIRPRAIEAGGS